MNEFGQTVATKRGWYWQQAPTAGLVALVGFAAFLWLWIVTDADGYLAILDDFNLIVHEAGHPLFGIFGETAGLWGGTLLQLIVPLVVAAAFLHERAVLSFCFATLWFFENFLNIGRYMADARAQELPLVGGGEHDWTNIFTRLDVLDQDTAIAGVVETIGWIGMIAAVGYAIVVWYQQQRRLEIRRALQEQELVQEQPAERTFTPI
jgi:hypothetical protein